MSNLQAPLVAVYYPCFEPPVGWLRAMLLFFDRIETIIPKGVQWKFRPETDRLLQENPKLLGILREERYLPESYQLDWKLLEREFKRISGKRAERTYDELKFVFSKKTGEHWIEGHTPLHKSKTTDRIFDLMRKTRLVVNEPGIEEVAHEYGDSYIADDRAANLVVGLIAEKIANENGYRCATNLIRQHRFNFENLHSVNSTRDYEGYLATNLVAAVVPRRIESMSLARYFDLWERHAPIRAIYRRFIREYCDHWDLHRISDPKKLRKQIEEACGDFSAAVKEEREKSGIVRLGLDEKKLWLNVGARVLGTIPAQSTKIVSASILSGLQIYGKIDQKPPEGYTLPTVKLVASLRDNIEKRPQLDVLRGTSVQDIPTFSTKRGR